MEEKMKKAILLAGLGVSLSASAGFLYYLLKREDNSEISLSSLKTLTSRQSIIRIKIPREKVGTVIGRQGCVINELQKKTNTKIRFEDKDDLKDDRTIIIRGSPDNAQDAETLIHELLHGQESMITEEIFIPVRACGRIIGKNGDTIRQMCHISNAKITVDRGGNERDPDNMKRVTIRGSKTEISTAVALIDEKLAEEEARRNEIISSSGRPNRYTKNRLAISFQNPNLEEGQETLCFEKLEVHSPDGFLEVYISAVEHPGHFWVQIIGPKAVELDKLVEDMTVHYHDEHNRVPVPDNLKVEDLVAAPFQDGSWYRGLVEELQPDEYSPGDSKALIHFLDFGDDRLLPLHTLSVLKTQFQGLPFQGIECSLAHIKPVATAHINENSTVRPEEEGLATSKASITWSSDATDMFEKLTYTAQWKVIMAKPLTNISEMIAKRKRNICYVELVDTNNRRDINVGKELVRLGLAQWDQTQVGLVD